VDLLPVDELGVGRLELRRLAEPEARVWPVLAEPDQVEVDAERRLRIDDTRRRRPRRRDAARRGDESRATDADEERASSVADQERASSVATRGAGARGRGGRVVPPRPQRTTANAKTRRERVKRGSSRMDERRGSRC
jgi:hypothetical protein